MSSSTESTASVPDNNMEKPALHEDDAWLNYAVKHLLYERNELLTERLSLGCTPIEYSDVDFLSPPHQTHLYMIFPCGIAKINVSRPPGARYPPDHRQFSKGTQTEEQDDDITLMDVDPSTIPMNDKDCKKNLK
ncbi:hypothetical protein EI94DRAFT_1706899 [Lactarius quietus]|nr:hypothetical protein EI94DRAFT_1706899 [Lactarius quietus]